MYSLIHHQTCSFEIYSSNFFLLINRCVPLKRTKSHPGSSVRDRISFMPILNNFAASGSVRFTFSQIGTYSFCCSATLLPIKLPLYNMKGWNPVMELHPAVIVSINFFKISLDISKCLKTSAMQNIFCMVKCL